MARLDLEALQRVMRRRNMLFKHQMANLVGISYDRLSELFGNPEEEVEEDIIERLCVGLGCERGEITVGDGDPGGGQ